MSFMIKILSRDIADELVKILLEEPRTQMALSLEEDWYNVTDNLRKQILYFEFIAPAHVTINTNDRIIINQKWELKGEVILNNEELKDYITLYGSEPTEPFFRFVYKSSMSSKDPAAIFVYRELLLPITSFVEIIDLRVRTSDDFRKIFSFVRGFENLRLFQFEKKICLLWVDPNKKDNDEDCPPL